MPRREVILLSLVVFIMIALMPSVKSATNCLPLCSYSNVTDTYTCSGSKSCDLISTSSNVIFSGVTLTDPDTSGSCSFNAGNISIQGTSTFNCEGNNGGQCQAGKAGSCVFTATNLLNITGTTTLNCYGGTGGSSNAIAPCNGGNGASGKVQFTASTILFDSNAVLKGYGGHAGAITCSGYACPIPDGGNGQFYLTADTITYYKVPDIDSYGGDRRIGLGTSYGGDAYFQIEGEQSSLPDAFSWDAYAGVTEASSNVFFCINDTINFNILGNGVINAYAQGTGDSDFLIEAKEKVGFNYSSTLSVFSSNASMPKIWLTSTNNTNFLGLFNTSVVNNVTVYCGNSPLRRGFNSSLGIDSNVSFDVSCGSPTNISYAEFYNVLQITDLNYTLLDLLNGLANYTVQYSVDGLNDTLDTCKVTVNGSTFTSAVNKASKTCEVSFFHSQGAGYVAVPSYNSTDGSSSAGSGQALTDVELYNYLFDSSVISNFSVQNFWRQYNITESLGKNFSNVLFSYVGGVSESINLTASSSVLQNLSYAVDLIMEQSDFFVTSTNNIIIDDYYYVWKNITYNNTESLALPAINLSIPRDFAYAPQWQKGSTGHSYIYNTTHVTLYLDSISSGSSDVYRQGFYLQPCTLSGRNPATYQDVSGVRYWTFNEIYTVLIPLNAGQYYNTSFNASTYLQSWGSRKSSSHTLLNTSSIDVTHTLNALGDALRVWFANATAQAYNFSLSYTTSIPSIGGGAGGGGGGGVGGGGVVNITRNITKIDLKPRLIDKYCLWTSWSENIKFCEYTVTSNLDITSCDVTRGQPYTDCTIRSKKNLFTASIREEDDSKFLTTKTGQLEVNAGGQKAYVDVTFRVVNLGFYLPVGQVDGLPAGLNYLFKYNDNLDVVGLRLMIPIILLLLIGGIIWLRRK